MPNALLNDALHHRGAIVVFDVTFPAGFWHEARGCWLFLETLLSEILNCVVISVGQEVMNVVFCRVVF